MSRTFLSIMIPVYNNARYLRELNSRIATTLDAANIEFETLYVDDGSKDGSWAILRQLADESPKVKALRLSRNFGQHAAISAALEHTSGNCIVLMDADLQDQPEAIPQLLERLESGGHDIVYTLKEGGEESALRRLTSLTFHKFVGRSSGSHVSANIGTFRVFTRKVADALLDYRERAIVYGPLMHTMGFDAGFQRVTRAPRIGSGSSYSFGKRFALAFQSIVSYSTLPQRTLLWSGGIVCMLCIGYMIAIIVQYLMGSGSLPHGLTLLATILLFLTGLLMIGLGILASYLFLIYREILNRPRYHVQQTYNLERRT